MGRARGQIGAPARSIGGGVFSPLLQCMANKLPPNERIPVKQKKPNNRAVASRATFPDEKLAAMRYDHERNGLSVRRCAEKYGIGVHRAEAMLTYLTRPEVKAVPGQPTQSSGVAINPVASEAVRHGPDGLFLANF